MGTTWGKKTQGGMNEHMSIDELCAKYGLSLEALAKLTVKAISGSNSLAEAAMTLKHLLDKEVQDRKEKTQMSMSEQEIVQTFQKVLTESKDSGANPFKTIDAKVKRTGSEIVLPDAPENMSIPSAILSLAKTFVEEEKVIAIHEIVEAYPLDGAHALVEVLRERYGVVETDGIRGFFGRGPATAVSLEIGYGIYTDVVWGSFKVPGIEGEFETAESDNDGRKVFVIRGNVKKKHYKEVKVVAARVRELVRKKSVYKGKAISLKTDDDGKIDLQQPPRFLNTLNVQPEELIFSKSVDDQVQTNLFTPVEKTERCRREGVPLKRGVLLCGNYGCGKTLAAYVLAKKCEENKWTFIMIERASALKEALKFARMYAPAVVFTEDIDRTVSGERNVTIDDVLNILDGVSSKGTEIITVLTSNHVDRINKAMLRPGRLDAIIEITPPDEEAAGRLIRLYGRSSVDPKDKFLQASKELAGKIPAVIREVVERSKLYAIRRLSSNEEIILRDEDLTQAARGMKTHLDLMNPPAGGDVSDQEQLGIAVSNVVHGAVRGAVDKNGLSKRVETIGKDVKIIMEAVS